MNGTVEKSSSNRSPGQSPPIDGQHRLRRWSGRRGADPRASSAERRGCFRAKEHAEIALFVIDAGFAVRELAAFLAEAEAVPTIYVRSP